MIKTMKSVCARRDALGFMAGAAFLFLAWLASPAWATDYTWNGTASSDWGITANWSGGLMAPTGDTYLVKLVINNNALSRLVYSAANGSTVYTNVSGTRCLRIADGANGMLAITGGSLETRGWGDFVGNSGSGTGLLLIDGGTYVSTNSNAFCLGANNGYGTLTISNGLAKISTINLWCSVGAINLVGGTLSLSGMTLNTGAGSALLNLNGGTLQAWRGSTAWLYAGTNLAVRLNGSVVFDTLDSFVTNAAPIIGTGTLTKIGSGALWLNVSNTLGSATVNAGTLYLGGSNTIASGIMLNAGTLGVNHAAALGSAPLTINGGRINNASGTSVANALGGPINVNSNFTFVGSNDLNLGTGTVSLAGSLVVTNFAHTLTFGGSVTDTVGTSFLTTISNGTLAIMGNVAVGGRVSVNGGGTLLLASDNTYTGATIVGSGLLIAGSSRALGATNTPTDVTGGGTLQLANGIVVANESVTIAGSGFDNRGALQSASFSTNIWSGAVLLNDVVAWTPRLGNKTNGVLIVSGPIRANVAGATNLFISGEPGGRVVIAGTTNTYKGLTGVVRGTLALGANNALPTTTTIDMHPAVVTDAAIFDLNGYSQTITALFETSMAGPCCLTNSSATASTLTLNQSMNATFAGRIDGNVGLVKDGAGTLTLSGTNNTFSGATTLKAGSLVLAADGALSPFAPLTLAGGTLAVGATRTTVQQLTVSGDATIDLGDGTGLFTIGDSSAQTWSGTLNFTGTFVPSSIQFGTARVGLTQEQLNLIRINGQRRWLMLNASGYLTIRKGMVIDVL